MNLMCLAVLVLSVCQSQAQSHQCRDLAQLLFNFLQEPDEASTGQRPTAGNSDDGPTVGDGPAVGSSNDSPTLGSYANSRVDRQECHDLVQLLYTFLQDCDASPTLEEANDGPSLGSSAANDRPVVGNSASSRADDPKCCVLVQLLYTFLQGPNSGPTVGADDGPSVGDGPSLGSSAVDNRPMVGCSASDDRPMVGSSANRQADQPILSALSPHHAAHVLSGSASGRHDDSENPPMLIAPAPQLIAPAPQLISAPVPPVMETAAVTGTKLFIHFHDCKSCAVDVKVYDTDKQTQVAASSVPDSAASYWTTVRGVAAGNEYLVRACVRDTQRCEDVLCPPQTQPLPGSTTGLSSCAATDVCASSSQPMCSNKHRREDRIMHILKQLLH